MISDKPTVAVSIEDVEKKFKDELEKQFDQAKPIIYRRIQEALVLGDEDFCLAIRVLSRPAEKFKAGDLPLQDKPFDKTVFNMMAPSLDQALKGGDN